MHHAQRPREVMRGCVTVSACAFTTRERGAEHVASDRVGYVRGEEVTCRVGKGHTCLILRAIRSFWLALARLHCVTPSEAMPHRCDLCLPKVRRVRRHAHTGLPNKYACRTVHTPRSVLDVGDRSESASRLGHYGNSLAQINLYGMGRSQQVCLV